MAVGDGGIAVRSHGVDSGLEWGTRTCGTDGAVMDDEDLWGGELRGGAACVAGIRNHA